MKTIFIFLASYLLVTQSQLNSQTIENLPQVTQEFSLLNYAWSTHSQFGEEGILDEILKRLKIENGFFVEFGAWDGVYLSNTRFLGEKGWRGAFIESDKDHYLEGLEKCKDLPAVSFINKFVTWDENDPKGETFDQIADQCFPDEEIDVLSIDIDGADYLIFEGLKRKPKVIIVEGGQYWHPMLNTRIPDDVAIQNLQQPLAVICKIGKEKGYTPVCFTINTFFIRNDLYTAFDEIKNDPVSLWFDGWFYYGKTWPGYTTHTRAIRSTNPNILQFDPFPTP